LSRGEFITYGQFSCLAVFELLRMITLFVQSLQRGLRIAHLPARVFQIRLKLDPSLPDLFQGRTAALRGFHPT